MTQSSKQSPTITRAAFRFMHRLRVRWVEVDMQKIVFNGHYLMYLDTAIADYWRALAMPYEATMHQLGGDLYVKKASLEYHGSARYDEQIDIGMRCQRIGNSSMIFEAGIFRGDSLLISAELIYVFADPESQTSKAVPPLLRELVTGFEAGEAVLNYQVGNWQSLSQLARPVRDEVFLVEQKIPKEMEWDEQDASAVHAVACNRMGLPVATGRLITHAPGVARIGRMAVNRVLRGSGLGRGILGRLMQAASSRGDRQVLLHAQCSAEGFYRALGFRSQGPVFSEAGIEHIEMVIDLPAGGRAGATG
jgi:YbgC/YbaW family acyl-CoA thioester hydrolase